MHSDKFVIDAPQKKALEALSDEQLVQEWQENKTPMVLDLLYLRFEKRLFRYFFSHTFQINDAEDLLIEMSIKLITKLETYQFKKPFENWLFKLAHNLVHDYWKKHEHEKQLYPESELSSITSTESQVDFLILEKLKKCLKELSEREYKIFFFKHSEEQTYREIGNHFNFSLQMAEKTEKNTKEKLAKCLKTNWKNETPSQNEEGSC